MVLLRLCLFIVENRRRKGEIRQSGLLTRAESHSTRPVSYPTRPPTQALHDPDKRHRYTVRITSHTDRVRQIRQLI
jgi:hypothetical protein